MTGTCIFNCLILEGSNGSKPARGNGREYTQLLQQKDGNSMWANISNLQREPGHNLKSPQAGDRRIYLYSPCRSKHLMRLWVQVRLYLGKHIYNAKYLRSWKMPACHRPGDDTGRSCYCAKQHICAKDSVPRQIMFRAQGNSVSNLSLADRTSPYCIPHSERL